MDKNTDKFISDAEITSCLLQCGPIGICINAMADELREWVKDANQHTRMSKAGAVEAVVKTLTFAMKKGL